MNKSLLLILAISAVSFINTKEYTIGEYYDYFIELYAKTGETLDCPAFLLSNKEKFLVLYYTAAINIKQGTKRDDAMGEVGLQITGTPGFRAVCQEIPMKKIIKLLISPEEQKKEINQKINSDIYIKNGLSVEGLSYMFTINSSDLKERFIKSSEYLGKFLALFLQLTDRDSNKILNKFNNSL